MGDELANLGIVTAGGDGELDTDLWTTPALQEEPTLGEAVCPNLSGFDLRLLLRAIMDIRPLLSPITRRPQGGHRIEPGFRSVGGTVSPFVLSLSQTSAE
ncbi:hypothetical protein IVA78_23225 [Bradyrhizobium sp. 137]|nr:hypothetical protein [Bradyrhizobium sp. 137]